MIYNPNNYDLPDFFYLEDKFTKDKTHLISNQMSLEEIKKRIDDYDNGYYQVFSSYYETLNEEEKNNKTAELIDQYKMFQKSSEDLVSRRQSTSSFYISVNSAIVAFSGILLGLFDTPIKLIMILFMSIIGIVLDISWINILDAYSTLNSAKMKVITMIEKTMPIALYDTEWQIMSDKLNNKKYVSFTNREKRIPVIFLCIYGLVIAFSAVFLIISYCK